MATTDTADGLIQDLRAGSRRTLSKCLSLLESTREVDRDIAYQILERCKSGRGHSWRIGCTGPPGAGKSTFIARLGCRLADEGRRVAVLAIDPSSRRTGGSILGDKVRMAELALRDSAFIRPTPSKATLGGAAPSTRDAILVCEEAGYDTIIIETVGVGQSEVDVADMVDIFLLLALPNSGDDVQGIKRGIMEVADAVLVSKCDADPQAAQRAASVLAGALRYTMPSREDWQTSVLTISSTSGQGFDDVLDLLRRFFGEPRRQVIEQHRKWQRAEWFDAVVGSELLMRLRKDPLFQSARGALREQCIDGVIAPSLAVHRLVDRIHMSIRGDS